MQLLEITTRPVRYELQVEHARLEYRREQIPRADVETTPARVELHSRPARLRLDTYEARRSLGAEGVGDRIRESARKGLEHIRQKTREAVELGQAMSQIQDGVTIGQIVRRKLSAGPAAPVTAFLPSGGAEISWVPGSLETRVDRGGVRYDFREPDNATQYVPGRVRLVVLEPPGVDIRYVGEPLYFPPRAGGSPTGGVHYDR